MHAIRKSATSRDGFVSQSNAGDSDESNRYVADGFLVLNRGAAPIAGRDTASVPAWTYPLAAGRAFVFARFVIVIVRIAGGCLLRGCRTVGRGMQAALVTFR